MRPLLLKAFALGFAAGGMLAYALAAAVAVVAQAGAKLLDVHLGPVVLVAVQPVADGTTTTFGSGLLGVALLCGLANAIAAGLLARRLRRSAPVP